MPKVNFLNENVSFDVPVGTTILDAAKQHEINLFRGIWQGANCSNWGPLQGSCGRCNVWVRGPNDALDPLGGNKAPVHGGQVRACKTKIEVDIEVRTKPGFTIPAKSTTNWDQEERPSKWKERLVAAKAAQAAGAAEEPEAEAETEA